MIEIIGQLLNYTLSFLFWMLLGRIVLTMLIGERHNFFTELIRRATDPALYVVRRLTPKFVADRYILVLSLPLIIGLRIALLPLLIRNAG